MDLKPIKDSKDFYKTSNNMYQTFFFAYYFNTLIVGTQEYTIVLIYSLTL
jgi:hypothetical protein